MDLIWKRASTSFYKLILSEGIPKLPSIRWLTRLLSCSKADIGLNHQTIKYLEQRVKNINDREIIVTIIMDEVY
uniref:Uncharacterized protein n=1 Tax=Lepeophtheirus salmonis TaxID=72036 RepID=A0A0K2TLQ7_LEPSM